MQTRPSPLLLGTAHHGDMVANRSRDASRVDERERAGNGGCVLGAAIHQGEMNGAACVVDVRVVLPY